MGETQVEHRQIKLAEQGSRELKTLDAARFFTTFSKFYPKYLDMDEQFDRFVIGLEEHQKQSVKYYFEKHFNKQGLNISFKPKPKSGAQVGQHLCVNFSISNFRGDSSAK
jgi:hypothetical protein